MVDNESKPELVLDVYLKQFEKLREESFNRMQSQNQSFNNLLLIMGVAITALVSVLNATNVLVTYLVFAGIALFLPLITAPLGLIFFDNEIVIYAIGSYIDNDWLNEVRALVKDPKVFGDVWEFKYLHKSTRFTHTTISVGRWLLYLIPTVFPILSLVAITIVDWGWWNKLILVRSKYTDMLVILCVIVFVLDVLITYSLLQGIIWNFKKHGIRIKPFN